jgi:hypothetical protein
MAERKKKRCVEAEMALRQIEAAYEVARFGSDAPSP